MMKKPTYEELEQRVRKLEESERELVFRNKQLGSLVNNSGFGIVFLDKGMKIVGCNEAFEELFLYAQGEMEGKTLDELIVDGDQVKRASAYTKTTLTGKNIQGSGQRRRKDGALIDVKFNGIPITVDGEVIGAYGVYEDITALTKAEEALRESEDKYRILVEESPLAVSLIGKDGRYRYLNRKFTEIFGYILEEIPTGREWFRKVYPDQEYRRQVIWTWINDQKETKVGEARPRTYVVKCKDGSEKTINFKPVTLETGEQFVICEDIT